MGYARRGGLAAGATAAMVSLLALAACTGSGPGSGGSASSGGSSGAASSPSIAPVTDAAPQVRVDQVGYPPAGPKVAYVMLPRRVNSVSFTVSGDGGRVLAGRASRDLGRWNARYQAVYQLVFTPLARQGSYRIRISAGGASAVSPAFAIAPPAVLYQRLVRNGVRYFTSERDGSGVVGSVLDRKPANLTDRRAFVYRKPRYDSDDNLVGGLHRIGGPVNVSGGWFDAGGGYEKFAFTSSYADGLLLLAARDNGAAYPTLGPEAQYGLQWLERLWNPAKRVMYVQVGIGTGNKSNTIQGDYNFWFLPQREDRLDVSHGGKPGPTAYYVKYRPVFPAAPPGKQVSPELAGRFAADFALGAQLAAARDRARAGHLLSLARGVYAMAQTRHVKSLLTAFPHDFYPGTEWKSAMLWGAAEIALADEALHVPATRLRADLRTAARWARAYLAQGHRPGGDTLNLYDNGAVAEAELMQAMRQGPAPPVIATRLLLGDLAAQLRVAQHTAGRDPFGLGTALGSSDVTPHAFGLYVTNALYQRYGGTGGYQGFAQQQLNYALGANPWGSSFVVGAGSTFPHCMQSEIANLAGSLDGTGVLQVGATSDGPSDPGNFVGLGTVSGMRRCSAGHYRPFDAKAAAYEDNVVAWPSVEPADDYTATSLLAFALGAAGSGLR
jgi:hypothetical protein